MTHVAQQPIATGYGSAIGTLQLIFEQSIDHGLCPSDPRAVTSFVGSHFAKFVATSSGGGGGDGTDESFDLFAGLDQATQGKRGLLDARTLVRPRALDEPGQLGWVVSGTCDACTVSDGHSGEFVGFTRTYTYRFMDSKDKVRQADVVVSQTNEVRWMRFRPTRGVDARCVKNLNEPPLAVYYCCHADKDSIFLTTSGDFFGDRRHQWLNAAVPHVEQGDAGTYTLLSFNAIDEVRFLQRINTKDDSVACVRVDASVWFKKHETIRTEMGYWGPGRMIAPNIYDLARCGPCDVHVHVLATCVLDGLFNDTNTATALPACSAAAMRIQNERLRCFALRWKANSAQRRWQRLKPLRAAVRAILWIKWLMKTHEATLKTARESELVEALPEGATVRGDLLMAWDLGYAHRSKRICFRESSA